MVLHVVPGLRHAHQPLVQEWKPPTRHRRRHGLADQELEPLSLDVGDIGRLPGPAAPIGWHVTVAIADGLAARLPAPTPSAGPVANEAVRPLVGDDGHLEGIFIQVNGHTADLGTRVHFQLVQERHVLLVEAAGA